VRMKGMPRVTRQTITSKSGLVAELAKVRQEGYAIDDQENEMEGRCIGAPIHGPDGRIVAALSISSPVFRAELAQVRALAPSLKERVLRSRTRSGSRFQKHNPWLPCPLPHTNCVNSVKSKFKY